MTATTIEQDLFREFELGMRMIGRIEQRARRVLCLRRTLVTAALASSTLLLAVALGSSRTSIRAST